MCERDTQARIQIHRSQINKHSIYKSTKLFDSRLFLLLFESEILTLSNIGDKFCLATILHYICTFLINLTLSFPWYTTNNVYVLPFVWLVLVYIYAKLIPTLIPISAAFVFVARWMRRCLQCRHIFISLLSLCQFFLEFDNIKCCCYCYHCCYLLLDGYG